MKFKVGDKVRILDGSKMLSYRGCWNPRMGKHIGNIVTVESIHKSLCDEHLGYRMEECDWTWYERWLELVESEKITINHYKNKVVAKMGDKVGVAKCSPNDTFDLYTGTKLAIDRLFDKEDKEVREVKRPAKVGEYIKIVNASNCEADEYENGDILKVVKYDSELNLGGAYYKKECCKYVFLEEYVVLENYEPEEKSKEENPKYYNGKAICVKSDYNMFTAGKIYTFKNGRTTRNYGDLSLQYESVDDLNKRNKNFEFIELVEN